MKQLQALALGAFVVLFGAGPAFAISESSVTSATGGASVATVSVNAASGASIVALISGDGPSTASSQTTSVSGCGLSWVLVKRANTRPGVADVWKTATSASLSACAVTGRLVSGSFFVRLTVVVIDGSSGLGASASASGKTGAARAMLTSIQDGSLAYGVGSDWSVVQARTVLSGQRKLAESTPSGLGTFWAQALTGVTAAGSLTVGTSAPSSTNWNFAAVELTPSGVAPPPPPPCTFTVSPTTLTAPAGGTSSSVTVTASASTCAWTAASNAWLSVAPTSGTGSGSVSVTSAANSGAVRSASVTVAGTSITVNQDAAAVSGPPTLVATCPGAQSATSPDGQPVAVSYPAATTTGGVAPVTVAGTPASGSLFSVGTTMVTQAATSSDGQSTSCTHGVTVTSAAPPPAGGALLHASDLTYVGSFRLQGDYYGPLNDTLQYSASWMAGNVYNDPVNGKSLLIKGLLSAYLRSNVSSVGQFTIPTTILNPNTVGLNGLTTGMHVNGFTDMSQGRASTDVLVGQGHGALVVYGNKLIGTEATTYDGSCAQVKSAWVSSLNFSAPAASGGYKFSTPLNGRMLGGGYMSLVPPEWQAAFGAKVLSGNGPDSIISCGSPGPALFAIDADRLITQPAATTVITSTPLVYYQDGIHSSLGVWNSNVCGQVVNGKAVPCITVTDPHGRGTFTMTYNDNSMKVSGVLFADNTRSVLFFGRKGLGKYCYGDIVANGGTCVDPDSSSKGDHAYPYSEFVWAYDANDLLAVKNGTKQPWDVYPYAGWTLKTFNDGTGNNLVGAAWDPETRRVYLVVSQSDWVVPLVHVYQVGTP